MLKNLNIQNYAVIESLELNLLEGMTVFTGETGAGKSILVDALGLVLGDRADSSVIRSNCDRCEITAIFQCPADNQFLSLLDEQDIGIDNEELIFRRTINKDGRSRAYINGSPVTVQLLRDFSENIIDIHGQHAHQSLIKQNVQQGLLDEYGAYTSLLDQVSGHYQAWHSATNKLLKLRGENSDTSAQLALLQYQVNELEELELVAGEYEALHEEYKRLDNANRLLETSSRTLDVINQDEHSITNKLDSSLRELQELVQFDPGLETVMELLGNASIQLDEAVHELREYHAKLELDPERLDSIDARLGDLHSMARKHQVRVQDLHQHLQYLAEQLHKLENSKQYIEELELQQLAALSAYREAAETLSGERSKSAKKMSKEITSNLKKLGMSDAKFKIEVDYQVNRNPQQSGNDHVEYLVTVNPGQPEQPLQKVASGGELSRISLAIQVVTNSDKGIPTLVFDEVDAGIGGGVAEIVGQQLKSLVNNHQVLCVTHLPQIASLGDHHIHVGKSSNKVNTTTRVHQLSDQERVEEIARMLGGIKISEKSLAHAREMLKLSH